MIKIFFFSSLFSLILCEFILRIFGLGYGSLPLDGSKILHHEHPRNYKYRSYFPLGEYGGFNVVFNEIGNRVSENFKSYNSKQKIAFLGDSFTEAAQVKYEDSFVGKINKNYKIDVFNFGVSSYSPIIYLAQIRQGLKGIKPTDIVIQIFENDISDDKLYFKNINNSNIQTYTEISGEERLFLIKLFRYSYFARLLRRAQLQIKHIMYEVGIFDYPENNFFSKSTSEELTFSIIKEIKKELKKLNIELYLFVIPNKQLSKNQKCCEKDLFYNRFRAFSKNHNINFIDVGDSFQNYKDQKKLFFVFDIHLTENGHTLINN